ncbi:MAG: hypothetical protein ISR95_02680 [Candidatus Marinimicrobia bacterium]|nr:hypothetical protein [Candidatus Neomarinimicrobiota bacterium]
MKKEIHILPILILSFLANIHAGGLGTEIDVEVQLLPTGQFNLADWDDPNINLWLLTVHNKTSAEDTVFIEFRMEAYNISGLTVDQPVAWGVTKEIVIQPGEIVVRYTADFSEESGNMWVFELAPELEDLIRDQGYLPAGDYDIKMIAWSGLSWNDWDSGAREVIETDENEIRDLSWDHTYIYNQSWSWSDSIAQLSGSSIGNILVNTIALQEPIYDADVVDPYPWFRWDSPGFRSGVIIDYRIKVAQFNPELHSSYEDALEDANLTFFDSNWDDDYNDIYHIDEYGSVQTISIQFPSGDRDLACGYQYVWQVGAREHIPDNVILDFDMAGFEGVWGWPEPIESEIRIFNYGSIITQDKISSPAVGGVETTVRPTFSWDQIACADEYEIWLSDADDPEVENPIWQSDPIQSIPFQYPIDAPGLMPGKEYKWKVRINPGGEVSPWSDIASFSIESMTLAEPLAGETVNTVLPTFNANVPNDIAAFELRISDPEDETVDIANVFSEVITTLPYQFPTDAMQGLYPGQTYYWKLLVLDSNGNLVGSLDDYTEIGTFSVTSINLLTPNHQEIDLPLNPIFSWEGPVAVPSYEFNLSDSDDPEVENPLFTTIINGTFYQYPTDGDYPLEYGTNYYWKVIPLDVNENPGPPSDPWFFTTMERPLEPAPDLYVTLLGPIQIQFSFSPVVNADYYHLMISETNEVGDDQLLSDQLWEIEELTQITFNLTPDEFELEYSTQYYTQVVAMKDELTHSFPSEVVPFETLEMPGASDQPEISIDFDVNDPRILIISLVNGVTDATAYIISLSDDPSMENITAETGEITSFPYIWSDIADILDFLGNYYLQILAYKDSERHGIDGQIMQITVPEQPGASDQPEVQVSISNDAPRSPMVNFTSVANAVSTHIMLSNSGDTDDNDYLVNIIWETFGVTQNTITISENDIELDYNTAYYIQVVGEDASGAPSGLPSNVVEFFTLDPPGASDQVQISISLSTTDVRIPIINLISGVANATTYTATIAEDLEMTSIVLTHEDITSFPIELTDAATILQYETTYYVQVSAFVDGQPHGLPSSIEIITIPAQPGTYSQPEFSTSTNPTNPRQIVLTLVAGIEGATEYVVTLAQDQDMNNILFQDAVLVGNFPFAFDPTLVDWGTAYFVQLQGAIDGEAHGLPSDVQIVNIPIKPGSDEQVGLSISRDPGSLFPSFEIINTVTGATEYVDLVSTETDMSVILWEAEPTNLLVITYPADAPPLEFGQLYYIQAYAIDEDGPHGIPSTVISLFIPNIVPPVLGAELFVWEASIPSSASYLLEISLTEDFAATVVSQTVQVTTYPFSMDELDWGTAYYWRVQGLNEEGSSFGAPSDIGFFQTESVPAAVLNSPVGGVETTLLPEFSWDLVEQAAEYLIELGSDDQFDNILWNLTTSQTSAQYPESASLLQYATTYYWRVATLADNGEILSLSSVDYFNTSSVFPVTGLTPNETGVESLTPTLSWNSNENAANYHIQISIDVEFTNILLDQVVENNQSVVTEATALSEGTNYYWHVDALDAAGESLAGVSETATFFTPSLEQVTLLSPVGTPVNSLTPQLSWGAVSEAVSYQLTVASDDALETVVIFEVVPSTEITVQEETLLNDASYYWQVQAFDNDGNPIGIASDVASFTTPSAININIQELADGANISTAFPLFSWESAEGVAAYQLQFASNADFSEAWEFQTGATQFPYPQEDPILEFDQSYYWRIRPLNNEGNSLGAWTAARFFSITNLYIVQLEAPASGSVVSTAHPTFQWQSIEAAVHYEIMVSSSEEFDEIKWQSDNLVETAVQYPSSGAEPLEFGITYFWKVRALGEEQPLGDFSQVLSFQLSSENIPVLSSPVSTTTETITPLFIWQTVENADFYGISFSYNEDFSQIFYQNSNISEAQFQYPQSGVPVLDYDTTYYWQVVALDQDGNAIGDPSTTAMFTTTSGVIEIDFSYSEPD